MRVNGCVKLFDVVENQTLDSGIMTKSPIKITSLNAEISPVGANTYWAGSSERTELLYTVQMHERSYKDQKYIAFKNRNKVTQIFQIHNVAKGESLHLIKLNCKNTEESLEELIESVI
jgi:hypothetical protein